jgi:hypothetical protein
LAVKQRDGVNQKLTDVLYYFTFACLDTASSAAPVIADTALGERLISKAIARAVTTRILTFILSRDQDVTY